MSEARKTEPAIVFVVEGDEGEGVLYAADTHDRAQAWVADNRGLYDVALAITAIEVDRG